jgi:glycosyltransferase involved in cell wall biosynthesis
MPRVSVIIPAYNAAPTLPQTLRSVLEQTYRDYEIAVVDDGSTDRTAEVVERSAPAARCLRQGNAGVAAARNHGIDQSSGELVAYLDADDLWEPTKLERQVGALDADPKAGVCYVAADRVDGALQVQGRLPARQYDDTTAALLLYANIVSGSCSSAVVRRAVTGDVRFDGRFSQCADWHYWLRLSLGTEFLAVDEPLVKYRSTPGNMSSDIPLLERDTFGVLADLFERKDVAERYGHLRNRIYGNHWMILAGSYLHAGEPAAAVRCAGRGLRADPASIRRPLGLPYRWARRAARKLSS